MKKKPFTFQELFDWDKRLQVKPLEAFKEAYDRGYKVKFTKDEKGDRYELYDDDKSTEPCATGWYGEMFNGGIPDHYNK